MTSSKRSPQRGLERSERGGTEWVRQHEWVSEFWKGSVIWEQNLRRSTTCRQHVSLCVLMQCFVPWLVFVLRNNFHLSSGCPTCCSSSFPFFYSVAWFCLILGLIWEFDRTGGAPGQDQATPQIKIKVNTTPFGRRCATLQKKREPWTTWKRRYIY